MREEDLARHGFVEIRTDSELVEKLGLRLWIAPARPFDPEPPENQANDHRFLMKLCRAQGSTYRERVDAIIREGKTIPAEHVDARRAWADRMDRFASEMLEGLKRFGTAG